MAENKTSFVTTLGGQPQIVTFILDLLLARGEVIDEVIAIYLPENSRYQTAYERLQAEFPKGRYSSGGQCRLRAVPVKIGNIGLSDAYEPAQIEMVRSTFHDLLSELKQNKQAIHLGLSGGRRVMSLVGLAAAMQYLSPTDHIWHIYTPDSVMEEVKRGQLMHVPPEWGVRLIEVPFVPWVAYFPGLSPLMQQTSSQMISSRLHWLNDEDRDRCRRVWDELTKRQRDVLCLLANGSERNEIAQKLHISVTTVDSHREAVLSCCELIWAQDGLEFSTKFWMEKFRNFIGEVSSS